MAQFSVCFKAPNSKENIFKLGSCYFSVGVYFLLISLLLRIQIYERIKFNVILRITVTWTQMLFLSCIKKRSSQLDMYH